jgi:threonine dehydratase
MGIQVPDKDMSAFRRFLQGLGYPYQDESANAAYHLFLR